MALAIPIDVYAGGGETCAAERLGSDLNCTANDVQLVNLVLSSSYGGPLSCVAGQTITLDIDATFQSSPAQRYDVGFFVSEDGKSPQDLPGSGGANTCHVGILPETPDPPFADLDGDNCGEVRANQSGTTTLTGVTVRCQADTSGQLEIPMVVSWSQNAGSIICMSSLDPVPGTTSKCSGGLVGTIPPIAVFGSLTIRKETVPDGDPQAFNYSASTTSGQPLSTTGFALTDGQSQPITIPITGSSRDITVTEAALSGWNLSSLSCVDGNGNPAGFVTTDLATRTVTANLSATNPTATCTYTNQKHPDLAITKTGPASVNVGAPIGYTITATNNGPGNVSGASIADTVPANITAVTWICAATGTADCDTTLPGTGAAGAGNSISLENVAINAGAGNAVTIAVSGTATIPGPITNTATIGPPAGTSDPLPANNSASVLTGIGGVLVTGYVYNDANHSSAKDGGEGGTALTLYAKLVPAALPVGPALLAAAVDPATGAYSMPGVPSGIYIIVIDDNALLADVTPTLPAGWIGTEVPDQRRTGVSVGIIDVPNQNFGVYHGSRITGRVFNDQGSGGGTPNDGVQNGAEPGIAGVDAGVTDGTGTTTFDSTVTGGGGDYTLWVPAAAGNNPLRVVEANLTGYLSSGGQVGTTGGTYDRGTDVTAFTHTVGTIYAGVNFADVPVNQLNTDGLQSALPVTTLYYPHSFTAGSAGEVGFATSAIATPALPGWSEVFYRDANCNGQFDAGEPQITAPISMVAGDTICILVKEFVPAAAPLGAQNVVTVTASFTYTNASPALATTHTRTDTTTVGDSALRLQKAVDKAQALPGELLTYTITYTNTGSKPLTSLVITDATPVFSTFNSASCGAPPAGLTCTEPTAPTTAPPLGGTGPIIWGFTGSLLPGASSSVQFTVRVDS